MLLARVGLGQQQPPQIGGAEHLLPIAAAKGQAGLFLERLLELDDNDRRLLARLAADADALARTAQVERQTFIAGGPFVAQRRPSVVVAESEQFLDSAATEAPLEGGQLS